MGIKKVFKREVRPITPELLYEVVSGKYGDPSVRSKKLKEEGYNPSVVTKKINALAKLAEELKPILDDAGEYISVVMEIARSMDA